MDLTWTDLTEFVFDVVDREGARPTLHTIRLLANQSLKLISRRIGGIDVTLTSDEDTGLLTLTGATAMLPSSVIRIKHVHIGSIRLDEISEMELETRYSSWRTQSGIPGKFCRRARDIALDCIPSGGLVTVYATRGLEQWTGDAEQVNPLEDILSCDQLMPAYYVLGELPARRAPVELEGRSIGWDLSQIDRKAEYIDKWKQALVGLVDAEGARKGAPYRGN